MRKVSYRTGVRCGVSLQCLELATVLFITGKLSIIVETLSAAMHAYRFFVLIVKLKKATYAYKLLSSEQDAVIVVAPC